MLRQGAAPLGACVAGQVVGHVEDREAKLVPARRAASSTTGSEW
jgi:hypothetical protein